MIAVMVNAEIMNTEPITSPTISPTFVFSFEYSFNKTQMNA